MEYNIDFSIIIPQRNSLETLPKLLQTIPFSNKIEIILVDNTPIPILKEDVKTDRNFILAWSDPLRHAGGARNVGIENAHGKWLVFADADDYFTTDAFDIMYKQFGSDADVIYFEPSSIYSDTGKKADRGEQYADLVKNYLQGIITETDLRLNYHVPWGKMVKRDFVINNNIKYDEVRASNDTFFGTKIGYFAKKIDAVNATTYVVTVNKGSLTRRRSYDIIHSRFLVCLRRNKFLREHNLNSYQASVMVYLYQAKKNGIRKLLSMIKEIIKYRQNPFVGYSRWLKTFFKLRVSEKKEAKYIVK